jgi:NAD(P)-dependent dehydrogenase (short-subunit alcohol dehydrogenase family)
MYESKEGDEKGHEWHTDLTPLDQSQHWSGRVGRIEDLYNAVMFLATTRFMTGEEIVLDGGMTKKMQYEV